MMVAVLLLYSEDEPGKQAKSAITIKNTSKCYVAFKVNYISPFLMFATFQDLAHLYTPVKKARNIAGPQWEAFTTGY